jgi:ribose 5-phosphate isomerase B
MIALASDHIALGLKTEIKALLDEMNLPYMDFGTDSTERTDYPIYAARAARAVVSGACDRGIIFCGTGIGISIAANKVKGIRCMVCSDCYSAKLGRQHNDTNMLALGARVVGVDLAKMIAWVWLTTDYEGGRHQHRIDQITVLEDQGTIE